MRRTSLLSAATAIATALANGHAGAAPDATSPGAPATKPAPQVELVGQLAIPDTVRDRSGLEGTVGGVPHDRFGSWGSAIDWTGQGNIYLVASDRGPLDGGAKWRPRMHRVVLKPPGMPVADADDAAIPGLRTTGSGSAIKTTNELMNERPYLTVFVPGNVEFLNDTTAAGIAAIVSTTPLSDERGRPLMGNSGAFDLADPANDVRLDPEGVRLGPDGTIYISDEYGPSIDAFDASGKLIRRFAIPDRFKPLARSGLERGELPPANTRGRQPNRGFEGLAISEDGGTLFALLQSPLIQDSAGQWETKQGEEKWERTGTVVRLLAIDVATGATKEYAYPLASSKHGLNEILAVNDGRPGTRRFLTIERDGKPGSEAAFKKIMLAELGEASGDTARDWREVTAIDTLPATATQDVSTMRTRPLIDLLDPAFGLAGPDFPEKIEGLAWGPDQSDGRRTLIVTSDNDLRDGVPTHVWFFAVSAAALR
jgi:hypothetical protein